MVGYYRFLRVIIIVIIIAAAVLTLWQLTNKSARSSKAGGIATDIKFSKTSDTIGVGQTTTVDVLIEPTDQANDTIDGVDITLNTDGQLQIVDATDVMPVQQSSGSSANFTKFIKTISANQVRLTYAVQQGSTSATNAFFTVSLTGTTASSGNLTVDTQKTSIYDKNAIQYGFNTVDSGVYTIGNSTLSPSPILSVTTTPVTSTPGPLTITPPLTITTTPPVTLTTQPLSPAPSSSPLPTPCPVKGDANCDGNVDKSDFYGWADAFTAILTGQSLPSGVSADVNGDGVINLFDFETWRQAVYH